MDIEKKVLLLAILKKKADESLKDVLFQVVETGTFSMKDGKSILKELKKDNYIDENNLTFIGISEAKKIEQEFRL